MRIDCRLMAQGKPGQSLGASRNIASGVQRAHLSFWHRLRIESGQRNAALQDLSEWFALKNAMAFWSAAVLCRFRCQGQLLNTELRPRLLWAENSVASEANRSHCLLRGQRIVLAYELTLLLSSKLGGMDCIPAPELFRAHTGQLGARGLYLGHGS